VFKILIRISNSPKICIYLAPFSRRRSLAALDGCGKSEGRRSLAALDRVFVRPF
jgi:hypothetical protein